DLHPGRAGPRHPGQRPGLRLRRGRRFPARAPIAGRRSPGNRLRPVLHGARDPAAAVRLLRPAEQRRLDRRDPGQPGPAEQGRCQHARTVRRDEAPRPVAQALVHRPPVIILDEPTAGVDVDLRRTLWDFITRLNQAGHTILLTTHYLEEAEALCGRVAMLKSGQIVALDTTQALMARVGGADLED